MVIVTQILPAIRVMVARELVYNHGLKPIEAAVKMDVTPAAITQYIKGLRGKYPIETIEKSRKAKKIISELTSELVKDEVDIIFVLNMLCKACKAISSEGLLCDLHKELMLSLRKHKCKICPMLIR